MARMSDPLCGSSDGCGGECLGSCGTGFTCVEDDAETGDYECNPNPCPGGCPCGSVCSLGNCVAITCPGGAPVCGCGTCCPAGTICAGGACVPGGVL